MAVSTIPAPGFPVTLEWFNTDHPARLTEYRGRVVLLNFSTYGSLQCVRTLDDLEYLENRYQDKLMVIGVHTSRFPGERTASHIQKTISRHHINHPLVNDADICLAQQYGIRRKHAIVVIDTSGNILGSVSSGNKRYKLDRIIGQLLCKTDNPVRGTGTTATRQREPVRPLSFPGRILAANNRVFIADSGHNRILETSGQGQVLHQYGSISPGLIDGIGTSAAFNNPQGMALSDEYLYVADTGNHAIRRIHLQSEDVITIAGTGKPGSPPESDYFSTPEDVDLNAPCGLVLRSNVIYIAMSGMHQVWALSLITNRLEIFAGSGSKNLKDGASRIASFAQPSALTIMGNTLYAVDAESSSVRAIDLDTRNVLTLTGTGLHDFGYCDGSTADAKFQYPLDLNADQHGKSLWVADTYNNKIRRIGVDNNLVSSVPVDYPLNQPGGLAFDDDTLYIANTNLHEIVRINLRNGNSDTLNVNDESAGI